MVKRRLRQKATTRNRPPARRLFWGLLFSLVITGAAVAATDPQDEGFTGQQRNRRAIKIPPRVAVEACIGKQEGDPCSFSNAQGTRSGQCLSGLEDIFACRPFRDDRRNLATNAAPPEPPPQTAPLAPPPQTTSADRHPEPPPQTPPVPPGTIHDHSSGYMGLLLVSLAAGLCASALTWYVLYCHSTVPLRRLRAVTQRLAEGDLAARVGEGLVHRKSEVVDLGRDVDRMAERIECLVGAHQRLIRDVSHELRSPLARLNVALELARQSAGPAHSAPFDRIERESERLNELIGQLLMLTKLESESGMGQGAELNISALLAEVAQDVDFEAQSNERQVVFTGPETLVLNGNKELLRQALENLIRNAARYTASGTAVDVVLKRTISGGRDWAHIEVRDHGPGVPEAEINDIFRPFYRVNDVRDRQSGGAGVGLAISERAVHLHGGRLKAINAPGGGLIMEVELPVA